MSFFLSIKQLFYPWFCVCLSLFRSKQKEFDSGPQIECGSLKNVWYRLEYDRVRRGTVRRLNGPLIAQTPHSPVFRSDGISSSRSKSVSTRKVDLDKSLDSPISLAFLSRIILLPKILRVKALSDRISKLVQVCTMRSSRRLDTGMPLVVGQRTSKSRSFSCSTTRTTNARA